MVVEQRGTKARTCCVGLDVWGVVRWQACLLLHNSVPGVEASNKDKFTVPPCEWVLGYSVTQRENAISAVVDHSWSKLVTFN